MNRSICVLLLFFSLVSCSKHEMLTFETIELKKDSNDCELAPCASVEVVYEKALTSSTASSKINKVIQDTIVSLLDFSDQKNVNTVKRAVNSFHTAFLTDKEEFPSAASSWNAEIYSHVDYQSDEVLTISVNANMYTGGAHGNISIRLLNFDPKTGELLSREDLFEDMEAVEKLAETYFRKEHKIPTTESINSTGFYFEKDQFHLPENVGYGEDHMVMIYNQYEIASYVEGVQFIELPLQVIRSYLKRE